VRFTFPQMRKATTLRTAEKLVSYQKLRAQRNPTMKLELLGALPRRDSTLQLIAMLLQLPPRKVRDVPVSGPVGFVVLDG